jgi:hypothetical protein
MTDMEWTPSLGERMTRLETLFETHLASQNRREDEEARRRRDEATEQRRRDEIANERWRDLAASVGSLVARLDKFEPVILGARALGQKSIGERLETVERVVLSAKVGWRTASFIGAAILSLASALAYLLRWTSGIFPPGSSAHQ